MEDSSPTPKQNSFADLIGIDDIFQSIGLEFNSDFDFGSMFAPAAPAQSATPPAPASPSSPAAPSTQQGSKSETSQPQSEDAQTSQTGSTLGQKALEVAKSEAAKGVKEEPPGSNDGPRVREYQQGNGGNYWCAHFVSWCVNQAGTSPFGHTGSVSKLRSWGQNNGKYTPASRAVPQPGDIFTKQRTDDQGRVVGGHTGFVLDFDPSSRRMRTVEGNSDDRVRIGSQSMTSIDGIVRL